MSGVFTPQGTLKKNRPTDLPSITLGEIVRSLSVEGRGVDTTHLARVLFGVAERHGRDLRGYFWPAIPLDEFRHLAREEWMEYVREVRGARKDARNLNRSAKWGYRRACLAAALPGIVLGPLWLTQFWKRAPEAPDLLALPEVPPRWTGKRFDQGVEDLERMRCVVRHELEDGTVCIIPQPALSKHSRVHS